MVTMTAIDVRALVTAVIAAAGRRSSRPISAFLREVESNPNTPAEATSTDRIKAHLAGLTRPEVKAVCVVAWLAWGDFGIYRAALSHAKDAFHASTAEYIATKGLLITYLSKGLERGDMQ